MDNTNNHNTQIQKTAEKLGILQLNLGRSKAAHDLANILMREKEADIVIISEPNKKIVNRPYWITNKQKMVTVLIKTKTAESRRLQGRKNMLSWKCTS